MVPNLETMTSLLPIWLFTNQENRSSKVNSTVTQESQEWPNYSVALHILLPVAGFCLLWGRRDLLTRLLLQIDRSCISVFCPSFSKREKLLKWASENLPCTWSSPSKTLSGGIPDLWKDGSLLCTLINMVVPGACPNPPKHWKKPPTHAQALAYKYLGIIPVFTDNDFAGSFSPAQERKFLFYLQELQHAIKKHGAEGAPPNISSDYLVKGMGLHTGEQHRKTTFYIYSNTTNSKCNNILVYIRGPYGTQGTATVPAFHNLNSLSVLNYVQKQFRASDKIMYKKEARKSFLESIALDFTSFVSSENKVLANDVPIRVEMEHDRAKVTYIPNNFGIYEITLITNGEIINGSPFTASVIENSSGVKNSFENSEQILNELPSVKKKKIISRFIDCIDEKIQLSNLEEGVVEKPVIEKIASVSIVTDDGDSLDSKVPVGRMLEALPHAVIQYEIQSNNQEIVPPQLEILGKLPKIHEDQNEGEAVLNISSTEIASQNLFYTDVELSSKERKRLIPSISITEPESNLNTALENSFDEKIHSAYHAMPKTVSENASICYSDNIKMNIDLTTSGLEFSPKIIESFCKTSAPSNERKNETPNQNDKISIKPFCQSGYDEGSSTLRHKDVSPKTVYSEAPSFLPHPAITAEENISCIESDKDPAPISCDNKEFIEDQNSLTKISPSVSSYEIKDSSQNRPTSVVHPFVKIVSFIPTGNKSKQNKSRINFAKDVTLPESNPHDNSSNKSLTIFNENSTLVLPREQETKESRDATNVENVENQHLSRYSEEQRLDHYKDGLKYNISDTKEFEPEDLLLTIRQKKNLMENSYVESLKTILMNKINSQSDNPKIIKDFVNTTHKLKNSTLAQRESDENNNKVKHEALVSSITSPICTAHIAPEVEPPKAQNFENLSLSEKRRFFTRQSRTSLPSSNNSSISEKENEDVLNSLDRQYSLRVLSVIDTIKKTTQGYDLNREASKSVPNIAKLKFIDKPSSSSSSEGSDDSKTSFSKTREYWKNKSLENCSKSTSYLNYNKERPVEPRPFKNSLGFSPDVHKSADDILSITSVSFKSNKLKRCCSLNQKEFEALEFISIEERKKMLLHDKYEREHLGTRFIKKPLFSRKDNKEIVNEDKESSAKLQTARNFKNSNSPKPSTSANQERIQMNSLKTEVNGNKAEMKESKPISQFRRAVAFFKNLEKSSSNKKKSPERKKGKAPEIRRRFSLDFHKQKKEKIEVGGSLRLPKTSEKFSVSQIYYDIMENKRGSFKGLPNRSAMSQTLASISSKNDSVIPEAESENSIKYNMFFNKLKTRKRRSIRSIFDIHY